MLAARASPWWLQRGRDTQAHKQGCEQAASAVAQVEAERLARRAQSVKRLEAVLQRLQVESRREDVKDAVDRARQLQSAGEWVLDEMGAEAPIDASESDSGGSTSEGGGVSLAKDPPPRQVQWAKPAVESEESTQSISPEAIILGMIGEAPEGRKERINQLIGKVSMLLRQVQETPTEITAKKTRLTMIAENEASMDQAVALGDALDARCAAVQLEEGIIAAGSGEQNDDRLKRRCLVLNTPIRQCANTGEQKGSWSTPVETLVDSGASRDFINTQTVKQWGLRTEKAKQPLKVQVADGRSIKVDTIAHVDLKLDEELVYRTRAFVMDMGSVATILGITFFDTVGACQFDSTDRTLTVTRKGRTVTLKGSGRIEAQQRAAANALLTQHPSFLEVISPEEGAKDLRELKRITRRAERVIKNQKGKSTEEQRRAALRQLTEQMEPTLLDMRMDLSGETTGHLAVETPELGTGKYRAYVRGVHERLMQEERAKVLHVDVTGEESKVFLVTADERDELDPFGRREALGKGSPPEAGPKEYVVDPTHQELVDDILNGKIIPGEEIDTRRYNLQEVVAAATREQERGQKLVEVFEELVVKGVTLGEEFWTEERREALTQQLASEYQEVVRQQLRVTSELNEHLEPAPIRLREDWDQRAPYERSRRLSPQELEVLREQLAELLELGLIEPSASPFGAAVMIIPKPHQPNKFRMVIDYRRLNALTVPDKFPLPDIGEILEDISTQGHKYWASFDLCSGFYNIPILPEHAERTAMSTPLGSYQWRVMPMGLRNAPSIFQRNMARLFRHVPEVRIFIDDGVVGGATVEELYLNLRKVMNILRENKLIMKKSKLAFFKTSLSFLGHVVSREGLSPQVEKVEAVRNWPLPQTKKDVRAFLGLCQFYSTFIYNASYKMQPLIAMTKDDGVVPATGEEWNSRPEALDAFNELKYSLCHAPVLAMPDYKAALSGLRPFRVQTDASEAAMGAVLMQDQGEGWRPIAFASRTFTPAQINYSTTDKELAALVWATTEKFRHYILGTVYELEGDHRALISLLTPGRVISRRQARWIEILQEQGVPQMTYVEGKKLVVPDALSRRPDYMALIPTARQGLLANPRYAPHAKEGPTTEENDEYFTSKTRPTSMLPRDTWMPPILTGTPRAPTLRPILQRNTSIPQDANLPTGVMPHGKVSSVAEIGGGELSSTYRPGAARAEGGGVEHTHYIDTKEDMCRTMGEFILGIWSAPLGPQPSLSPLEHVAAAAEDYRDTQDWQVKVQEFRRWHKFYRFTVDGCTDKHGRNRQLETFWHDCMKQDFRGQRIWFNPPFNAGRDGVQVSDIIERFRKAREEDPRTAACFLLPYLPGAEWEAALQRLEGAECVFTYPTGTHLFYAQDGGNPPTKWPVQVWWCPPLREETLLTAVQKEPNLQQEEAMTAAQSKKSPVPPRRSRRLVQPTAAPQGYEERLHERRTRPEEAEREAPEATEGATVPRLVNFLEELLAAQQSDTQCQEWSQQLENHERRDFRLVGKLLWRIIEGRYQLVIPAEPPTLRDRALRECHDAPMAGHWGKHKTLAILRQRFWWPNMAEDVAEKCRTCQVCQQTKVSRQRSAGQLHHADLPTRRWQEINLDFVTGLALTERGVDAIMTVTDRKSKMVHFIPLRFKGSDAQRIARLFIDNVWRLHGVPQKLFTDRDPRFTAAFWKEVCRLTGMMSGMTTAYHPQANGGAERTNATMEQILRAYVGKLGTDWDLHLSAAEYAINNSVSSATGEKPFVMMYGESPCTQLDLFVQQVMDQESNAAGFSPTAKKFVRSWQRNFRDATRLMIEAQARERRQFQSKRSPSHTYQVGEQVMLSSKAITSPGDRGTKWKLRAQYYGPLTVTRIQHNTKGEATAYQLELPRQWKIHNWFSEDKLKKYFPPDPRKWPSGVTPEPPPTQLVDGKEEYVVDRILGHRVEKDKHGRPHMQWLISWKGYGAAHDEWRSVEDINTGGLELDAWREYEDMRRLNQLSNSATSVLEEIGSLRKAVQQQSQEYLDGTPGSTLSWQQSEKPIRMLVLFSGTGSIERTVTERFPNAITVSIDLDSRFQPTHCCTVRQWMEMDGGMNSYPKGFFDVIWASPPCTEYSRAKTTGPRVQHCLDPSQPHRDFVKADDNVRAAREIITYLAPKYWFIENPVGHLAKRPLMRDIDHLRHVCTYCRYGTPYQKATHIWTNAILQQPLLQCTSQTPCAEFAKYGKHRITAQSGDSKTQQGSGGAISVYPVPARLVDDLVCKQFLPREYLGEVAVGVITCIWEGRQVPTSMSAADMYGLQEFILAT